MKKLWRVKVNNWGWDSPQIRYFYSREEAEKASANYPASDGVEYAGRFSDLKAKVYTGTATPDEEYAYELEPCGHRSTCLRDLGYDDKGNLLG